MEMLISQLKSASWYEKNNYYLFFSGVPPNEANLAGVMPRGKHFGFIFPQHVSMPIEKAILHELAHGIGALQHTFDDEYKIPQGNSASVCDYPPGTMFFKYQWDKLHDPGWLNGIADEQEDFALEVFDDIGEWVDIRSLQTPIITPSQKALNISGITQVKFNHGGATVLFRLQNGKIYSAVVGSNGVFYGYVPKELADGLTGVFTVEKANLLQQSLFKGFSHAAMNSEVYAKAFLQQNDVLLNCVCSYFFQVLYQKETSKGSSSIGLFHLMPKKESVPEILVTTRKQKAFTVRQAPSTISNYDLFYPTLQVMQRWCNCVVISTH
jgi:hypothetical protein